MEQVEEAFEASPESKQLYASSGGKVNPAMVTTAYQHLFNRAPSATEAQAWVALASRSGMSPAATAAALVAAAQNTDATALTNRVAYVQQWFDTFYAKAVTPSNLVLTIGATNMVLGTTATGDDVVNAITGTSVTLNTGDTIDGSGGTGILAIANSTATQPTLAALADRVLRARRRWQARRRRNLPTGLSSPRPPSPRRGPACPPA